ncbi:MAG: glycogen debranching protein GlgX [Myxococcota bacterium]|nr:glycogen debranching protein GlgX [Myxococcota bacterium]
MPRSRFSVTAGSFHPLGASLTATGVNFTLFSRHATSVHLVLFDEQGQELAELLLPGRTRHVWHGHVEGLREGARYGYRVDGPYNPKQGHRFNRKKLLLDPYAKAISGAYEGDPSLHLGYDHRSALSDLTPSPFDNAKFAAKAVVVDDAFDWQDDAPPIIPTQDLILYEAHLKGLTAHKSSGVEHPGTYLGAIEKIPHLKELGINAVELLPIHACHTERHLREKNLPNYWGYSSLCYFAPEPRYSHGHRELDAVKELKTLVRELHKQGIEVILDVVYNHTAEADHCGPTLSLRGIDNASYYQLASADLCRYLDFTGCGNTLNFDEPQVVKLVMDSLRYWTQHYHIDGFRFDLASALGRERGRFDQVSAFFMAVHQDPVISRVKLIAEPWDIGSDSYQLGNFPVDFCEWNGRFRDCVRKFVKSDPAMVPELASRASGSADLFRDDGRTPWSSVNFVTCHDGFTLWDMVSYATKHNEANGEDNRDGASDNHSWAWGVEGETDDAEILALRRRIAKNALAILLLSQGTPMLLGGDEMLRTQRGNNNAYCQDNELSWLDWGRLEHVRGFFDFTRALIARRKAHAGLRRRAFFEGVDHDRDGIADITWFGPSGEPPDWTNRELRSLGCRIQGRETPMVEGYRDEADLLLLFHGHWDDVDFCLPPPTRGRAWRLAIDTALPEGQDSRLVGAEELIDDQLRYRAKGRSVTLLVGR